MYEQHIINSFKAVIESSYIGAPVTREKLESSVSKAMGFPVQFPEYDEKKTATAIGGEK